MSWRELPAASVLGPPAAQLPYEASGNSCGFECQDTTTVYNSIAEDSLRGVLVDYVEIVSGKHSFISNQQILTDQTYVGTLAGWTLVSSREVYESSCGPNGDCTTAGFSDVGAGLAWDGTTKSVVRVGPCAAGECVSAWTGATWLRVAGAGPALCCSLSLAWDAPHSRLVVANGNSTMFVTGGLTGVRWWSGPAMPAERHVELRRHGVEGGAGDAGPARRSADDQFHRGRRAAHAGHGLPGQPRQRPRCALRLRPDRFHLQPAHADQLDAVTGLRAAARSSRLPG
jgi:hypothetical protein